jgi:hypothetical protein
LFALHKGGKNLCLHVEDAKRLLAYSPNTQRDTKLSISRSNTNFFIRSLLSIQVGWDQAKKQSHATVPLMCYTYMIASGPPGGRSAGTGGNTEREQAAESSFWLPAWKQSVLLLWNLCRCFTDGHLKVSSTGHTGFAARRIYAG